VLPQPKRDESCDLTNWKSFDNSWKLAAYSPRQSLESVFDVPDQWQLVNDSLGQALSYSGGTSSADAARNLMKRAVPALLNAAHPGINYPLSPAEVISRTNSALASGDRGTMNGVADELGKTEKGICPLD
jgi:hypothetical protein